jgi:hypothetical protein
MQTRNLKGQIIQDNNNPFDKLKNIPVDNVEQNNVDFYLNKATPIIEKNSFNLNQRMFIDNLINSLDTLNKTEKFNRSLFNHIIEFGRHWKDSVILLYFLYNLGKTSSEVISQFMNR